MASDRIAKEHLLYDETVECNSHIILRKKLHSFIYPNRIHRDAMFAINGNLLLAFFHSRSAASSFERILIFSFFYSLIRDYPYVCIYLYSASNCEPF